MISIKITPRVVLVFTAIMTMGGYAHAQTIIYSDPLTEYDSGTELNGQLVPTGTGAGTAWTANNTSVRGGGSGYYESDNFPINPSGSTSGVRDDGTSGDAAFLPFTPVAGNVYTLTATVTGIDYMFGFSTNTSTSTSNSLINTTPGLSIWNNTGEMQTVVNGSINTASPNPGVFFPQSNLTIVLDTTGAQWTVSLSNTDAGYSSADFSTGPMTLATNPTGLLTVGIVSSGGEPYNMTNFELTGQTGAVPEPGTWALMAGGLFVLVLIQRRKPNHTSP